jgi:DNA-binding response OmpR family regulator
MARVYIVEDNGNIRQAVKEYFEVNEAEVVDFEGVTGVLEAMERKPPDIIILDIMLPDGNGFLLAKEIRSRSRVPIIFLTAKEEESDRIMGFEVGGDDYVVKPFSTKELYLRVEAVLKRLKQQNGKSRQTGRWILKDNILELNEKTRKVKIDNEEFTLTTTEWTIIAFLAFRSGQALSRKQILGECLGYLYEGSERSVDTHIANIRNQLGNKEWIETIYGYGYRFLGQPV